MERSRRHDRRGVGRRRSASGGGDHERVNASGVPAGQQHGGVARPVPVPRPGHGEVLIAVKASTICGSDIRCIYHEHLGKGPEGYQGVIAGHEPCGQIVESGPGCRRFKAGDRVDCVSHLRLRRLQRLPPRLHDLLHQRGVSPRLRMAARRRHGATICWPKRRT